MTRTKFSATAWGFCLLAAAAAFCPPRQCDGEEPAAAFMQALREAKYFDVAQEYLDTMADSPLVPLEFKESLEYERGITYMAESRFERDIGKREKQLDKASQAFKTFLNTRLDHPKSDDCQQQLGNLLVERGRAKLARAEKSANKAALQKEARDHYDEAYSVFAQSQVDLKEKLAAIPKILDPKRDAAKIELRDRLRRDYLQAQLLSGAILEETADTLDEGDKERTELLTKASAEYGKIYEKYRTRIAGSYAMMYQGRCDQKLGKHKDALSYFTELMDQPDEFRKLKIRAINLAMVSWEAEKKLAEAVSKSIEFLKTERPNEMMDTYWLELKVRMGRAATAYIKELQAKSLKDPQIKLVRTEARKLLTPATKYKSDYQDEARKLLAELQGVDAAEPSNEEVVPKTFTEAREAGKEALDSIGTSALVLKTVPQRIAREKDPAIKADLEKQLAAAQQNMASAQTRAKKHFETAIQLTESGTPQEEVDLVRYFLCYLYYQDAQYLEASLVGEYVSTHAPGSAGARQSAKIALASYIQLYTSVEEGEDKSYETERIKQMADFIIKKWPDQPEAEEAVNTMIPFLIKENRLDVAMEYVNKIPVESPRRGEVELKVGQALWSTYLRGVREARKDDPAAPVPPGLAEKKKQAQAVLTAGIERMEKAGISEQLVAAALSLAQISVDGGDPANAVKIMEHPTYGLVKLADAGEPVTKKEGVAEEIYKVALRAYISSLADGGGDRDTAIAKAQQMMEGLDKSVGDSKKLVGTYVSLARSLEKQLKNADPQQRKALSEVFSAFLDQVGNTADDFSVLNWVAQTFRDSLGGSNVDARGNPTAEAKVYFQKAAATYGRILEKADQPGFLPTPRLKEHLKMEVAKTEMDLGHFKEAKQHMVDLLKEKPMNVNVQVAAAELYQRWGAFPGMEERYLNSMYGAEPSGSPKKNVIWGWGRIAKLTQGKKQFANVFHNARVQLAVTRYRLALTKGGAEKTELLNKAKRDISIVFKIYPSMGGKEFEPKYETALEDIQRALNEPAIGLKEFKDAQ